MRDKKYQIVVTEEIFARRGDERRWHKLSCRVRRGKEVFATVSAARFAAMEYMMEFNRKFRNDDEVISSAFYECFEKPLGAGKKSLFCLHNRQFLGLSVRPIGECVRELMTEIAGLR